MRCNDGANVWSAQRRLPDVPAPEVHVWLWSTVHGETGVGGL